MYGVFSVRVTFIRRMYYVPFLSAAYLFCTNCFLIPEQTVVFTLFMQFAHYSYQLSEVEDATVESRLTPKEKKRGCGVGGGRGGGGTSSSSPS